MWWPFRRSTGSPETESVAGPTASQPAAAQPAVATQRIAAPQGEWRRLPALQRFSAELVPIAPAGPFQESLATHQDPRFLAPLGHALDDRAPAGEVTGLAETAPPDSAQEVAFPAPPAASSGTPASGAPASLQRSAEVVASGVPTYSLPSATMRSSDQVLLATESRQLPVIPGPIVARVAEQDRLDWPPSPPTADEVTLPLTGESATISGQVEG
ncbi:MAG: hypothetical protein QOG10_4234, partial [Kribbellaceae bacterium]|nr:hypothetical protein [Kribbellaceae bacterium]